MNSRNSCINCQGIFQDYFHFFLLAKNFGQKKQSRPPGNYFTFSLVAKSKNMSNAGCIIIYIHKANVWMGIKITKRWYDVFNFLFPQHIYILLTFIIFKFSMNYDKENESFLRLCFFLVYLLTSGRR
jgi:hypothetical protein